MATYRYKWVALFGICILAFTAFLDFTIVNTALPFVQKAFKTDILTLQWVANIFPIILSMTMIAAGKLGEYFGTKKFFYSGITLFGAAALFAGFSPNIEMLIFFRGLQGLGASISYISSNALLSETFHKEERIQAIGIYGGITGLGLMLGPFFGGILVGLLSWRWVFWINIPLIAVGLICCIISLKGSSKSCREVNLDLRGLSLLILGLGALMYGIIASADAGLTFWISSSILIGITSLGFLIYFDLKATDPLLNFAVFKTPLLLLSIISCSIAGVVSYVFMFFDPLLLENVLNLSPFQIGFMIAIIPAAQVIIAFSFEKLLKWIHLANLLFLSSVTPLISALWHLGASEHSSIPFFFIPFALLGINWGLSNTATITAVNENVAPAKVGETLGTVATIWNIAGSILLAVSTVIFHEKSIDFLSGFRNVIAFNLVFILLVILIAMLVRRKIKLK